jgi:hypothetical protein
LRSFFSKYFDINKILCNFAQQILEEKFGLIATSIKNAKTDQEINYYGIHRKRTLNNKFIFFDNIYFIDEFVPEADEEVTVRLLLGN